jgi:hypothetical protein
LQYIGPFRSDSHPQIPVGVLQKGSHSGLYSKKSNPEAENGVYKNFNAYLRCLYKQIYKNAAIKNGITLVNKKGQPMKVSLISDFIASATNIEVHIPSGTNSGS